MYVYDGFQERINFSNFILRSEAFITEPTRGEPKSIHLKPPPHVFALTQFDHTH